MATIDLDKYPKIAQMDPEGCIPINIENTLKYFDENNYDELKILVFFRKRGISLGFKETVPYFAPLLPRFKFIFKGKEEFNGSIKNVVNYIKKNIDQSIPVLVSFKKTIKTQIYEGHIQEPIISNENEVAHIRTAIGYYDKKLIEFKKKILDGKRNKEKYRIGKNKYQAISLDILNEIIEDIREEGNQYFDISLKEIIR